MPRICFTIDHTVVPHPSQSVAYQAGKTYLVSQAVAAEVIRLGRGYQVPSPGERTTVPPLPLQKQQSLDDFVDAHAGD